MSTRDKTYMGPLSATLLVVGACIGSAILSISGVTICVAGASSILSWGIAALVFAVYGLVLSKLTVLYPCSGGIYVFPRRAIGGRAGRALGFFSAWGYICSNIIAIGFSAVFAGTYLCAGFPGISSWPHAGTAVSVVTVIVSVLIILRGGRRSELMQNLLAVVLVSSLMLFCGTAFWGGHFQRGNFSDFFTAGTGGSTGFISAVPLAMVAYGGCVAIAFMASEVKDSSRNIPKALFGGLGVVALLYACVIASIVGTLSVSKLQSSETLRFIPLFATVSDGSLEGFGWLSKIISLCSFTALTTTVIALLRVNARALQALSDEGFVAKRLGRENSRGVLSAALVAMGVIVLAMCFFPGVTSSLISLGAVLNIVSMTITCIALIASLRNGRRSTAAMTWGTIAIFWACYIPDILRGGDTMWLFTAAVYLVGGIFYLYSCKKRGLRSSSRASGGESIDN